MTDAGKGRGSFWWARIGSLLGILPLGLWTANHVWQNLQARHGAREWERAVTGEPTTVEGLSFSFIVVLLPLVLHTVWGVVRLKDWRPNNVRWGTFSNLRFALQRLSAIGLAGFLGAHVWLAFLRPRFVEGHAEPFEDIAREMHHHGPTLMVYLLGTLGAAFHLGNGVSLFAWKWGFGGEKATRRAGIAGIVVFVLLLAASWTVVYTLWQAGSHLPPPVEH